MGAGKSTIGRELAERLGRSFRDVDAELEHLNDRTIGQLFEESGEQRFRELEAAVTREVITDARPAVIALGGGAVTTPEVRDLLRAHAFTLLVAVDVDEAWERSRGTDRPLARDETEFRRLYEARQPLYEEVANGAAADVAGAVLAAGNVVVEAGAFARLGELAPKRAELVSDERVLELHRAPIDAPTHVLPRGEEAKTIAAVEQLWRALRLDRSGTIVAVGGGCVTDAAGFAAAGFLRGIEWIAVPTTLVGQVDASIGGKTAINLPEGKNLVGAFHWPARTVIDPELLATLADEQRREGAAEVVKTGLLTGERLWELSDAELVRRCATFKTAVCLRDPHDRGPRQTLNLGHTFAHALETAAEYEAVTHGRAVALGLLAALRLSGRATDEVEETLAPEPVRVDRERAWQALLRDKKSTGDELTLVLLGDDGGYTTAVAAGDVRRALDELIAD
jgi:shikimate kinase / 3-dehydroquinate synthase